MKFTITRTATLRRTIVSTALTGLIAGALHLPASAQTAYPLICLGGERLVSKLTMNTERGMTRTRFVTWFTQSTLPYSRWTLRPGECAWRDRGMYASEPRRLEFETNVNIYSQFPAVNGSDLVSTNVLASTTSVAVRATQDMLALLRDRAYFTLFVYADASGYLVVRGIRRGD